MAAAVAAPMPQMQIPATSSRWADMVDESDDERDVARPQARGAQILPVASCRDYGDYDDDRSTQASDEDTKQAQRARWADEASEDEQADDDYKAQGAQKQEWTMQSWSRGGSYWKGWKDDSWYDSTNASSWWNRGRWSERSSASKHEVATSSSSSSANESSWKWQSCRQSNNQWSKGSKAHSNGALKCVDTKTKAVSKASAGAKLQCQYMMGIEQDKQDFDVVGQFLGAHGAHVKSMAEQSGAKFRLRGRGSGFREGFNNEESRDPLMLCVSAPNAESYDIAKALVNEHLEHVYEKYRAHCRKIGRKLWPDIKIKMHEGPREGSF